MSYRVTTRRGFRGLGAGECPGGYTFDGAACQPDSYDCTTPTGARGKTAADGSCSYILQPAPYVVTKPATTTTKPATTTTKPAVPSNMGKPCTTKSGLPGQIDYYGSCFYTGAGSPCGNGGIYTSAGDCINEKPAIAVVKPSTPAPAPTKGQRDAECRSIYGVNSGSVFVDGLYQCNTCGDNEVIDPSDNLCMCRSGYKRQITGNPSSPCVPVQAPEVQAGISGKAALVLAGSLTLAVLIYGALRKKED